ncbi:MAG: hypothetical protein WBI04_11095 [Trichlorobacter sp.]|jgi:hypothetical protein
MPLVVRRAVLLHGADDAPGVEEPEQLTWQTSHVMFLQNCKYEKGAGHDVCILAIHALRPSVRHLLII